MSAGQLLQLSELLGVTVTDVRQTWVYTEGRGRPTSPNAWRLELPGSRFGLEDPEWFGDGHPWSRLVKRSRARTCAAEPHPTPCPTHAASLSRAAPLYTPSAVPCTKAW